MTTPNSQPRNAIPALELPPGILPLGYLGLFPMPIPMFADRVIPRAVVAEIAAVLAARDKGGAVH
jgi:hypothetical protein